MLYFCIEKGRKGGTVINLHYLEYFIALCEYRNFTSAAASLYIAPSTLTTAIKKMENELGVCLFDRVTCTPTPEGEALLATSSYIIKEWNTLLKQFQQENDSGLIQIGIDTTCFSEELTSVLNHYLSSHLNVQFQVQRLGGSDIEPNLKAGSLDLGIMIDSKNRSPEFDYINYEDTEYGLFMHKGHPLSEYDPIPSQMLSSPSLQLLNLVDEMVTPLQEYVKTNEVDLHLSAITVKNYQDVLPFINVNAGTAIMPMNLVTELSDVIVRPLDPPLIVKYILVKNHSTVQNKKLTQLIHYLLDHH